jgi:hypothetical protein
MIPLPFLDGFAGIIHRKNRNYSSAAKSSAGADAPALLYII